MVSRALLRKIPRSYNLIRGLPVKRFSTVTDNKHEPNYLGFQTNFTNELNFINHEAYETIPAYRILNSFKDARFPDGNKLEEKILTTMYEKMVIINIMDKILYESQRQGRISFYMTNTGEEAVQIGSASAITIDDMVYAQYREAGVLLWRGFQISQFMNQCYGNYEDSGKGKQMPVHYGSKDLNFMTISSPLTTQLPQAVGAAYAFKRNQKEACVICYFGEGAASEGDAHAAFNFATTLECPIIFLCRNNGYAISTPAHEQFKGDGIAAKGPAYGINTIRVDGNDVLAVHYVTKSARNICIKEKKPVLIEAMTYRIGHHSTSDDSTAYRSQDEITFWSRFSPIGRFRNYLENLNIWNQEKEDKLQESAKHDILMNFSEAEKKLKPHWKEVFNDVYHDMPENLKEQMQLMEKHINQYYEHYPLKSFKQL